MSDRIQIRRDTAANWHSVNPTLAQGELGYEINSYKLKIGNGVDAWDDLDYYSSIETVELPFIIGDWIADGDNYYIEMSHNLNGHTQIKIYDDNNDNVIYVNEVRYIDENKTRIYIPMVPDLRFDGVAVFTR